MRGLIALLLLVAVVLGAPPARAATDADYRKLNQVLVESHINPRYRQFEIAADKLAAAAEQACSTRQAADFDGLKAAFLGAMDAWQSVQHIRFGPVEFFSRGSRIFFWPDPRNTVGRQVDELVAKHDAAALAPDTFGKSSVAGQGFPALETLLYGDDAIGKLRASGEEAAYRCALVRVISANLKTMGHDLYDEWTSGEDPYGKSLDRVGPEEIRFRHAGEVTVEMFKSLYTAIELVADHKLARPLGAAVQSARPRLAESWRSQHSLENIRRNLAAAQAMYVGENGAGGISAFVRDVAGDAALDDLMKRAFAQTLATVNGIKVSLEEGVGKQPTRPAFDKLSREAKALKTLLVQRLAPALNIPVGFNQLDGD